MSSHIILYNSIYSNKIDLYTIFTSFFQNSFLIQDNIEYIYSFLIPKNMNKLFKIYYYRNIIDNYILTNQLWYTQLYYNEFIYKITYYKISNNIDKIRWFQLFIQNAIYFQNHKFYFFSHSKHYKYLYHKYNYNFNIQE